MRSFDEKFDIWDTCHEHLSRENILIFKIIIFKKVAVMHGKEEFAKLKVGNCNIHIDD